MESLSSDPFEGLPRISREDSYIFVLGTEIALIPQRHDLVPGVSGAMLERENT